MERRSCAGGAARERGARTRAWLMLPASIVFLWGLGGGEDIARWDAGRENESRPCTDGDGDANELDAGEGVSARRGRRRDDLSASATPHTTPSRLRIGPNGSHAAAVLACFPALAPIGGILALRLRARGITPRCRSLVSIGTIGATAPPARPAVDPPADLPRAVVSRARVCPHPAPIRHGPRRAPRAGQSSARRLRCPDLAGGTPRLRRSGRSSADRSSDALYPRGLEGRAPSRPTNGRSLHRRFGRCWHRIGWRPGRSPALPTSTGRLEWHAPSCPEPKTALTGRGPWVTGPPADGAARASSGPCLASLVIRRSRFTSRGFGAWTVRFATTPWRS